MEVIFFFNRLIAASRYLLVFFLRCRSRVISLKKTRSKLWSALISAVFGTLALLLVAEAASAALCDVKNNPPSFVRHHLKSSYCELCGYGYITIIVFTTIHSLAAKNVVLPRHLPCLVPNNNIVDFVVTADFETSPMNCPWGDTYERYANTSIYLGGNFWACC